MRQYSKCGASSFPNHQDMLENLKIDPEYDGFLFLSETARNPPVLRSHHHRELEMNLVVCGSVTYVMRGKRYEFGPRSLLWLFPAQEHRLVDRTVDAGYYVAVFKPELIRACCRSPRYAGLKKRDTQGVTHCVLDPATFSILRGTMDSLMTDSLDPDLLNREAGFGISPDFRFQHGDPALLNAGLRLLLLLGWRVQMQLMKPDTTPALHPSVRKALDILGNPDLEEGRDLGRLAKVCGASSSHLSRLFKSQMGVSLNRYRNSARLGRFLEILRENPRATLLDAMFDSGFGSYAQFHKIYRQAFGESPGRSLRNRGKAG
jgi:AraC-like DNA-binding protein